MQTPLQIAWEHIEPSDFLQARIEREVAALERRFGRITSCKAHVEGRSHRQRKGGLYAIRVRLLLPGGLEIEASRNPPQDHAHEDAYVAIRDVFGALRRQLRERVRERREEVRHLDVQPHGLVSRLAPEKDHGFIRADDGREIYFHRNCVLTGFDRLRIGSEVHFAEEEGREGPQASSVRAYGVGARP
jgi:cold shock CspA family protein/ribosome-associated translation inhibitor RaiA